MNGEVKHMENKKSAADILKKIFGLLLLYILVYVLLFLGQFLGIVLVNTIHVLLPQSTAQSDVWQTGSMYLIFIGVWVIMVLYMLIFKKNRPILRSVGSKLPGNNLRMLGLGLVIGFGLNMFCALVAMLCGDIHLRFDSFRPLSLLLIFVLVFIQSSLEELMTRGFLYQRLVRIYGSPVFAMIANSLLFALLHIFNPGVTLLSSLNIFVVGLLFSLIVYYFDSLWCAFAVHAAWNFTQNILLGLPNSGLVVPYSVFKLDAARAVDSFAYNVGFGIEGSALSCVVLSAACVAVVIWGKKHARRPTDVWTAFANADKDKEINENIAE